MSNSSLRIAVIVSLTLHALLMVAFGLWTFAEPGGLLQIPIESVLSEERIEQDFRRELEESNVSADTINFQSGGVQNLSNPNAAANNAQNLQAKVEESPLAQKPRLDVKVNPLSPPRTMAIASGIADQSVQGETGALVDGYGEAMSKLTQELVGVMRERRVLVVWLLDESKSMEDDRAEIAGKIDKVFDELGIATEQDKKLRRGKEILTQAVVSYGRNTTDRQIPTADMDKVREAIKVTDPSQIDTTGDENMSAAIEYVCTKFGRMATAQKRKCIVILVSDESGDDGSQVERCLEAARSVKDTARLYVLGRESVFGQRTAYVSVPDPDPQYNGAIRWLPIRRGPETAHVECLQWNGLGGRQEQQVRSYFGPYEMVRLAKETGGIFFVLPGEEENLADDVSKDARKYDFLDMLEYGPDLDSRTDYEASVRGSTFRTEIFKVILALDPAYATNPLLENNPPKPSGVLDVYDGWYPIGVDEFRQQAADDVQKAAYAIRTLNVAIDHLERIEPLRAAEESTRWRANYDLIYAQCVNYKVRIFQSLLAMDEHANNMPKLKDEKSNRWGFHRSGRIIRPDEAQYERLEKAFGLEMDRAAFLAKMDEWIAFANSRYAKVTEEHRGTPWARRAQTELGWGFGMDFSEHYWNPDNDPSPSRPRQVALPNL